MISLGLKGSMLYWRLNDPRPEPNIEAVSSGVLETVPSKRQLALIKSRIRGAVNYDVLVSRAEERRSSSPAKQMIIGPGLPSEALVTIGCDVAVMSPAQCFVSYAARHDLIATIVYGSELCGTYACATDSSRARFGRTPLTCVAELQEYVRLNPGAYGARKARRALQFVLDNSASPMETAVELMLCLPPRHGGYGLPRPDMNGKVEARELAHRSTGSESFRCDLRWLHPRVAVEYNSNERHDGDREITRDSLRANALVNEGYEVIALTWDMVRSTESFDVQARIIASRLHKRLRFAADDIDFRRQRSLLRAAVLPTVNIRP